jgi:membrane-associated phospholipid phosphatase
MGRFLNKFFLYLGIGIIILTIIAIVVDSTTLWKFITVIGEEYIYIVLSIMIYSFNPSLGFSAILILMLSANINILLKNILAIPRPPKEFWRTDAEGYAFPSGHVQTTSSFWYTVALTLNNRYILFLSTTITLAVAISRVALRVHWLTDVVGGYLIGLAIVYVSTKLIEKSYRNTLIGISIATLALNIVNIFIAVETTTYHILGTVIGLIIATPIHFKIIKEVERLNFKERIISIVITLFLSLILVEIEKKTMLGYGWVIYTAIPIIVVSTPFIVCKVARINAKKW